jgi:hypothetical protein
MRPWGFSHLPLPMLYRERRHRPYVNSAPTSAPSAASRRAPTYSTPAFSSTVWIAVDIGQTRQALLGLVIPSRDSRRDRCACELVERHLHQRSSGAALSGRHRSAIVTTQVQSTNAMDAAARMPAVMKRGSALRCPGVIAFSPSALVPRVALTRTGDKDHGRSGARFGSHHPALGGYGRRRRWRNANHRRRRIHRIWARWRPLVNPRLGSLFGVGAHPLPP